MSDGFGYYSVVGQFGKDVNGVNAHRWLAGYRAIEMNLRITGLGATSIRDASPGTLPANTTETFRLGAGLSAHRSVASDDRSFAYELSYDAVDVQMNNHSQGTAFHVRTELQSNEYRYAPAMIFQVARGSTLQLDVQYDVTWRHDFHRGMPSDIRMGFRTGRFVVGMEESRLSGVSGQCLDVEGNFGAPGQRVIL